MTETAKVYRPVRGRIELWTPYRPDNRNWIKTTFSARPVRKDDRWLIARSHLHALVRAAADRYGRCEVWTDHRSDERCHTACQTAKGDECVCSCLGKHHRSGSAIVAWEELGDSGVLVSGGITRAHWVVTA